MSNVVAKYQKYAEYKDSGIDWLGSIPSHWTATALKRYSRITDGSHHSPKIEIEGFPFVSVTDVGINNINFFDAKKITETDYLRLVKEGCKPAVNDVLLTKDGTIGRACIVTEDMPDFVILSSLGLITPNKEISSHFLYYYLVSGINVDQMNSVIHGSALKRMTINKINDLILTFPDFYEQEKIASFLDHETAKIDTLIEKQQKLIALLKEKRQAVISHAVTKGLNPDAPMKDSGVAWLGEVPEHWDVIAISKVTQKITNGYVGSTRDILVEEGIPYVQATHIKKGKVNFDNAYFVREKWSNDHAKSILKKDDVLIVQTGAGTGDVGLVSESEEGFNCHALIILQPKKQQLSGSYLAYCLQSDYGYATLYSIRTGGMHPHLNCGEVQFVKISVPPLDEQVAISKFIEKNIQDFDQLIEKAKLAIQLMQERRTALISAAVTGKIDVRNWQAPTVAEAHTELSA